MKSLTPKGIDKGMFDGYDNPDKVLNDYLLFERPRPFSDELNDDVSQWFFLLRLFEK